MQLGHCTCRVGSTAMAPVELSLPASEEAKAFVAGANPMHLKAKSASMMRPLSVASFTASAMLLLARPPHSAQHTQHAHVNRGSLLPALGYCKPQGTRPRC